MPPAWREELRRTTRLAAPIVLAQLGQMGLGVVDSVMVGQYSEDALAGIALGHLFFWAITGFGYRILNALDPLVSQAVGRGDLHAEPRYRCLLCPDRGQ